MIEYFTPGGMVYFWRKTKPNKDSNSGPNVDKDLDKLAEFAMRVLREASEVLRSFSIEPRPSPKVCQFCSYAELCRSSPGLRDSPDTFEETA
jgi:ATP-dependent helicase/DNAse subunit B